ncbi:prepilin-type N-terminal cleavage/methylation domain-containing protein [Acinetobacter junii]|uniref:type IV pilin protein n=1 Tax=Acinetobacter junii TaxID=40215 RepID=UPI003A8A2359
MNKNDGFTLIELMVVLIIIAIIAAIAIPSYQAYARRALAAQMQQEMQRISVLLERHKARNFSYTGFNLSNQGVVAPRTYSFDLKDGTDTTRTLNDPIKPPPAGRAWALKGITNDNQNYNFLMTSTGLRCKNRTEANISYTGCGVGSEPW